MHQKDLARQAWEKAGLYKSRDPKVRGFLRHLEASPLECWDDLAEHVRALLPEHKALLAGPLWNTGDKLLRLNLVRLADPSQPDEMELLRKLAGRLDGQRDAPELRTMARIEHPALLAQLAKVKRMPPELSSLIAARHKALTRRPAPRPREANVAKAARAARTPPA